MKPNILFIVVDSFQADKCFNKNKTSITPNIDFLINNGAYFSQTISTSPTTVPSFASIFTGLYPFESVIREKNIFKINPNKINYIKNLINYGYNTYATIPKLFLFIGLDKIFETKNSFYYGIFWHVSRCRVQQHHQSGSTGSISTCTGTRCCGYATSNRSAA